MQEARDYVEAMIDHLQVAALGLYGGPGEMRIKAHKALCAALSINKDESRSVTDHLDRLGMPVYPDSADLLTDDKRADIADRLVTALCNLPNTRSQTLRGKDS